ncbi:CASP-LIKE PROTEIN 4A4 [Salix viminalis]|uniref:CASP-like protein n=1 Tax=Salix viminalis TaxID=40686 RepID=A0A9Q0YYC5_SALVM|nr:CASP-LIKE PROTEIN 4A4 [Salix viminalis]
MKQGGEMFVVSCRPPMAGVSPNSPRPSSFADHSELLFCFVASVLVFVYSAFQLFKGIYDVAQRGILISDKFSDYMSFILDQVAGYLLISSSSVAVLGHPADR